MAEGSFRGAETAPGEPRPRSPLKAPPPPPGHTEPLAGLPAGRGRRRVSCPPRGLRRRRSRPSPGSAPGSPAHRVRPLNALPGPPSERHEQARKRRAAGRAAPEPAGGKRARPGPARPGRAPGKPRRRRAPAPRSNGRPPQGTAGAAGPQPHAAMAAPPAPTSFFWAVSFLCHPSSSPPLPRGGGRVFAAVVTWGLCRAPPPTSLAMRSAAHALPAAPGRRGHPASQPPRPAAKPH
ncbi:translation initiation factor IF-2-like [Dermochelys coriacea]|uniref:translation initiation factor IF-2-like n=1 Tax=Dermochelys coriacea TaxID=27794 RepID=UPI0018E80C2D|nr:translation initiation factor IF-2-like [Dermochelys coriacea]